MSKPVFEDLFRFAGRRNRLSFFLAALSQVVGFAILFGVLLAAAATGSDVVLVGALLACGVPFLALCVSAWAVTGQRCRDFGWTGWAALITLLPYVGWIFAIAQPLFLDVHAELDVGGLVAENAKARAELGIPLKVGDRVIGALDVQSTVTNAFSPEDVSVLQTLADQIAVAVDNSRTFELAQEAFREARERAHQRRHSDG